MQVSSNQQPQTSDRIFVVTDVGMQAFFMAIAIWGVIGPFFFGIVFLPLGLAIGAVAFLRFRALRGGIVLNLDTGRLQFPGGDIEANDIMDYVNVNFILQAFKRFDVALADIQQINMRTMRKMQNNKMIYRYYLNISGPFGSATVCFKSEGKCQQCYAMIVQANEMGIPVVNR